MSMCNRKRWNCILSATKPPVINLIKDRQKQQIKYRHLCYAHENANTIITGLKTT